MPTNMWQGHWNGQSQVSDSHRPTRKIVTPSGGIVRGKFPSRKNGRMVHHEGLLELDAIYLFEASPQIVRYREQPTKIHYPDDGKLRRYTPDFELLLTSGETITVEVKPTRFLSVEKTRHKIDCIERYMCRSRRQFVVLTEKSIRQEPRLSNLRWIYHRAARISPTVHASQVALSRFQARFPCSIKTASDFLRAHHIEPFSLLMAGLLRCALAEPLSLNTSIDQSTELDDGWFWIAKEHGF